MDQVICHDPKPGENSSNIALKVVVDSNEIGSLKRENEDLEVRIEELGLNKNKEQLGNPGMQNVQENGKITDQDESIYGGNSNDYVHEIALQSISALDTNESASANEEIKSPVENRRKKQGDETEDSHVIDLRRSDDAQQGFNEKSDGETVCRICHLSSNQSPENTYKLSGDSMNMDLIQIGCGCKDELGIAHVYCAEAWFKLKGNRTCEICGEAAINVTGLAIQSFMEEWNEHRLMGMSHDSSDNRGRCWRGQPLCNFLLACLIIAFILPWFFHIDVF